MANPNFKMPPLEWVRAFEAAARLGSFTAAAHETGLTQSAISQRIGHLEDLLGATLFHRRPRSIALTLEGEAWLPHVGAALDGLRQSSEALFGAARGRLTISASVSIIDLWLVPRLSQLSSLTGAQISLQTMVLGTNTSPQDDVIGIRYGAGAWSVPYKAKLYSERIVAVAAPDLLQQGADWTSLPRITVSGPRPGWNDMAARYNVPTTPVPSIRFDTYLPAQSAARQGAGVLLASLPLCQPDLDAGRLVRLGDEMLSHHESYWVVARPGAISRSQWDTLVQVLQG